MMELLGELLQEAEKLSTKRKAASIYHRDYIKSKNKPYRQYDPDKYKQTKKDS